MNGFLGNMGWAIIALTLIIKALLFPLAYKSYASMAKMKSLQPEMEKIKERVGDDRMKMQQEVMALYKSAKVNPAAGCLPILIQIPIFFSLYKVIFVTLDLRHAGWSPVMSLAEIFYPMSIVMIFHFLITQSIRKLQRLCMSLMPRILVVPIYILPWREVFVKRECSLQHTLPTTQLIWLLQIQSMEPIL
jgi:YidC/Oxa1 family membrane protein insertase